MSVLGFNTMASGTTSFYVPFTTIPANPANIGAIAPNTVAAVSTIYTDHISIDGVGLDASSAGGGQLLVNGVAVATVNQNVSSIANWSQYPALSSITYSGGGGTGGLINMATGTFSTLNAAIANTSSLTVSSINGVKPVLNLTNWALSPALSTISYTAPGGGINMDAGSFSTLNGAALNVSSINGVAATNAVGVYQAMTTQHSVLADSANPNQQTLSFANDKTVTLTAGNWYIISALITWAGSTLNQTNDRFQIGVANIGGNLSGPQISQTYYAVQQVSVAQNGVGNVTNSYYYTTMVRAGATGTATLQIIATYPGLGGVGNNWLASQFNITPLGGNLN